MRHPGHSARAVAVGVALLAVLLAGSRPAPAGTKTLTFTDLMKLRTIHDPVISADGRWAAYAAVPDRGDATVVVRSTTAATEYRIPRGKAARISADSRFVAALVEPTLEAKEKAEAAKKGEDDREGPQTGLALLATADGSVTRFEKIDSFAFSEDGRFLAYHRIKEKQSRHRPPGEEAEGASGPPPQEVAPPAAEPTASASPAAAAGKGEEGGRGDKKQEDLGSTLVLRRLADGGEVEIPFVTAYAFAARGPFLAYAVASPGGDADGLYVRLLGEDGTPELAVRRQPHGRYSALAWAEQAPLLGFVAAVVDDEGEPGPGTVVAWDGASRTATEAVAPSAVPAGWFVPAVNELRWTRDGARLFLGLKPLDEKMPAKKGAEGDEKGGKDAAEPFDPYDPDAILAGRGVDVWNVRDPLIIPNQKKRWKREKDRTYRAVWHRETGRLVPLADREMRIVQPGESPAAVLGMADVPYLREITWDGSYQDLYRVRLDDGSRQLVARHLALSPFDSERSVTLSPDGRWVVYYRDAAWFLFDGASGATRNLTAGLPVAFADEDHDYPEPPPGYGVADWVEGGEAVLVYDKYDLWELPTGDGEPRDLTAGRGREGAWRFRVLDLDPKRGFVRPGERLLLSGYNDRGKNWGFFEAREGAVGVRRLRVEEKKYTFLAKAEKADRILYTREDYGEFPDLWVADAELSAPRRISDVDPEIAEFAWGSSELVHWRSDDGLPLDGVLIKPGNYQPGKRYPVLVYFYRFFSQRLHEFNEPVVNHRPSFPLYASDGYAIFLPDVRFEVGRPGLSAVKALVPGVQKLVAMGIADPDRLGLHGHSWSGYQTAFVVTQTDIFKAAVAGAPVSNMTSAYGGIRWESGLARQFQYEQSQSRIGASLWAARDLYIENSPLFYADRIHTPLLIEFGDEDGAVPWYQGIELYLALRRLGKEGVLLEYRGEGHHPKKYANKLDYAMKMKAFFDHYLKGAPAPGWLTDGVPYRGE